MCWVLYFRDLLFKEDIPKQNCCRTCYTVRTYFINVAILIELTAQTKLLNILRWEPIPYTPVINKKKPVRKSTRKMLTYSSWETKLGNLTWWHNRNRMRNYKSCEQQHLWGETFVVYIFLAYQKRPYNRAVQPLQDAATFENTNFIVGQFEMLSYGGVSYTCIVCT
jgi:hypothetical protein